MAKAPSSSLPALFRVTSILGMLSVYFLSTASAWGVERTKSHRDNNLVLPPPPRVTQPLVCMHGDVLILEGTTWHERCRNCTCTSVAGVQCDGPTCDVPYDLMHENICAKWADDGCCCSALGCVTHKGTVVPVGAAMPVDSIRPCDRCNCRGANQTSCVVQTCPPLTCDDAILAPAGQCCPTCPEGKVKASSSTVQSILQLLRNMTGLGIFSRLHT